MSKIIYIPLLVQEQYLKVDIPKFVPKIVLYRTRVWKQKLVYVISSQFLVKKQVLNL